MLHRHWRSKEVRKFLFLPPDAWMKTQRVRLASCLLEWSLIDCTPQTQMIQNVAMLQAILLSAIYAQKIHLQLLASFVKQYFLLAFGIACREVLE